MTIWFDMDGTIANLYGKEDWLECLRNFDPAPYAEAEPLVNMSQLARLLHRVQKLNFRIGIISWLSKVSTEEYDRAVTEAKMEWLEEHLPSVTWDDIRIVPYGTDKHENCEANDILFDDEERNRINWGDFAFEPEMMMKILREMEAE